MTSSSVARSKLRLVTSDPAPPSRAALETTEGDDFELLAAVRGGDPASARSLYQRLQPVVSRTASKLLGFSDRDLDDVVQTTMIEIITSIGRFRGESSLASWASTIAAHVVFKHIRRRGTERRIFGDAAVEFLSSAASVSGDPARLARLRQSVAAVGECLRQIDPLKTWTFLLHDVCGYDLREVAEITEVSIAAAQTRLVRGRREVHERIAKRPDLAQALEELEGEHT